MKPSREKTGKGTLRSDLRALPGSFWVLFTGMFINRFGAFVITFLALYLKREGYSAGQAGIAIAAYGTGGVLAGALGGYLADRIGRRNTIVIATMGSAVTVLMLYLAPGYRSTLVWALVTGVFNGMYAPASHALLADIVPSHLRVRGYAALRFAINGGFAFGMAAAGLLAKSSYFWLFAGDAATTLVFGIIAWIWLPHGNRTRKEEAHWKPAIQSILANRRFIAVFAATCASAMIFWQVSTTYALQVIDAGYSTAVFGLLMSMNGVMIMLFELPLTNLTHRRRPRRVMAFGYIVLGGGLALNAFSNSLGVLVLSMAVFTLGEMICLPVSSAYIARISPDEMRGRSMGTMAFAWTGATIVGPWLGMKLYEINPALVWGACGLLGVIAASLLTFVTGKPLEESAGDFGASIAVGEEPVEAAERST